MNQPHRTTTRRWIERPDAHRRWDNAYQLLLGRAGRRAGDEPDSAADVPTPEERRPWRS